MKYQEHGRYTICYADNILFVEAFGRWNKELAQRYCQEIEAIITVENPPYWGLFGDCRDWEMATPEVWAEFDRCYGWMVKHRMIFMGLACNSILFKHFIGQVVEHNPEDQASGGQFFSKEFDEVREWCHAQLLNYRGSDL
ncbi:hypothetical protein [Dongshaea marina]|uniref:hypothetical protein n=1 Tax=Dongshaea marina TaxID=2047966 RepID=UPI000D3E0B27|nr:hypothetical protein [Dongshaea marina]